MSIIEANINKEEFILPNNQKLVVEYGIKGEDDPIPADPFMLSDMKITSHRRLTLFDESGELIGTKIEKNPHEVVAPPGVAIEL
ncbi:MAG: hypothetical protein FWH54_05925 [Methanobrevibacter sp.]|nr:hypothetical protein [Methanobrevibacter sp.]